MDVYAGSDETLTYICPAELTGSGTVWGTEAYTADSATCRAALHAGAAGRRGGTVTVADAPGPVGAIPDDAERRAEHELRELRRLVPLRGRAAAAAAAAPPTAPQAAAPTQCPDNLSAYEGSDERFTCICAPERMAGGSVWGTDTYSCGLRHLPGRAPRRRAGAAGRRRFRDDAAGPGPLSRDDAERRAEPELRQLRRVASGSRRRRRRRRVRRRSLRRRGRWRRRLRSARTTSAPSRTATRR